MTFILGLNAYHGDSSACLLKDGKLVVAAEEERFCRIKHWAGLPVKAIEFCLDQQKISLTQIDHIAINRNPSANLLKKILFALEKRHTFKAVTDRLRNAGKVKNICVSLAEAFGLPAADVKSQFHQIEHHRAHLASSFYVSPFNDAALVSVDGFGDFVSTMWGNGSDTQMTVTDTVNFPHSLGLFYLAITQFLGFPNYGDEYKVMGLAPYGIPSELDAMHKIVKLKKTWFLTDIPTLVNF